MSGREYNKIAAGILVASLIAMISGKVVDILYQPNLNPSQRGYVVHVDQQQSDGSEAAAPAPEVFQIDIKALMAKASAEIGAGIYTKCAVCHTKEKGGPNRVGPNLWEIVGRKKASHEGYSYSSSLTAIGGEWDYDGLAHFIHKPSSYAKGTKMSFAGISKPDDIANLIAYLRTLSDSPKPLP